MHARNAIGLLGIASAIWIGLSGTAPAAPITSGMGPGGIGTLGVASSGPVLWLDAEDITGVSNNTHFATWSDSSTNGNNATNNDTTTLYRTNQINGRPVVALTATSTGVNELTAGAVNGRTFIATLRLDAGAPSPSPCCNGLFGDVGIDAGLRYRPTGSFDWDVTSPIGGGAFFINGTSTKFVSSNVWHTLTAQGSLTAHANLGIGQYVVSGADEREIQGDIGEVIVYDQTLNSAERQIVDSYMGAKYALTVTNDRYTGDTVAGYDRDVFGIGRVDSGNQSALSTGAAGFGIEAASLDDGDFVLAGHDAISNALVGDDLTGTGLTTRWNRIWYVDKTGNTDATLAFDFSDAGLTLSDDFGTLALLYRSGTSGDFVKLALTALISGDTISFAVPDALLSNGFYTLGIAQVPEPSTLALLALAGVAMVGRTRRRTRRA